MRKISPVTPYVFDNDCLASFLWVRRTDLLRNLFSGDIAVPETVVEEIKFLQHTRSAWVYHELQASIESNNIYELTLPLTGPIIQEYLKLTGGPTSMGRGEAAALSLVKFHGGTVASNNLKDVFNYCRQHNLGLISTDDILSIACIKKLITEEEGNHLWMEMKRRRRMLPDYDFSEALRRFKSNENK